MVTPEALNFLRHKFKVAPRTPKPLLFPLTRRQACGAWRELSQCPEQRGRIRAPARAPGSPPPAGRRRRTQSPAPAGGSCPGLPAPGRREGEGSREAHLPPRPARGATRPEGEERGRRSVRRKGERQLPPPFSASCSLSTSMAFRSPSQPPPPSAGLRGPEGLPPPPDALPLPRTHSRTQATRGWGDRREPGKRARERDRENEHLPSRYRQPSNMAPARHRAHAPRRPRARSRRPGARSPRPGARSRRPSARSPPPPRTREPTRNRKSRGRGGPLGAGLSRVGGPDPCRGPSLCWRVATSSWDPRGAALSRAAGEDTVRVAPEVAAELPSALESSSPALSLPEANSPDRPTLEEKQPQQQSKKRRDWNQLASKPNCSIYSPCDLGCLLKTQGAKAQAPSENGSL